MDDYDTYIYIYMDDYDIYIYIYIYIHCMHKILILTLILTHVINFWWHHCFQYACIKPMYLQLDVSSHNSKNEKKT